MVVQLQRSEKTSGTSVQPEANQAKPASHKANCNSVFWRNFVQQFLSVACKTGVQSLGGTYRQGLVFHLLFLHPLEAIPLFWRGKTALGCAVYLVLELNQFGHLFVSFCAVNFLLVDRVL